MNRITTDSLLSTINFFIYPCRI
ncbi:hypothetical protein D039_4758A, partial [Vibrio parahaemolyticus EKP-028]